MDYKNLIVDAAYVVVCVEDLTFDIKRAVLSKEERKLLDKKLKHMMSKLAEARVSQHWFPRLMNKIGIEL